LTAYAADGTTFNPTGTFKAAPAGTHYVINGSTEIKDAEGLADWLKTNVTTATEAATGTYTLTSVMDGTTPLTATATVSSNSVTYSPDISSLSSTINSVIIGGKTFAGYATTTDGLADGDYNVEIVYNDNAPLYTVTYHDVVVTTGASSDGTGTLKLMRVATSTVAAPSTYTYKWYVAADNTYVLPAGTQLTVSGANYATVEAYVAAQVSASASAPAESANAQTGSATVNVVGDPQGRTLTLTKTTIFGVTTWTCTDTYDMTGTKLTFSGGTASTDYTTLASISYVSAVTPTVTYSAASGG
jgi:hypothetical protein